MMHTFKYLLSQQPQQLGDPRSIEQLCLLYNFLARGIPTSCLKTSQSLSCDPHFLPLFAEMHTFLKISPLPAAAAAWGPQIHRAALSSLQLSRARHPRHLPPTRAIMRLSLACANSCCVLLEVLEYASWSTSVHFVLFNRSLNPESL